MSYPTASNLIYVQFRSITESGHTKFYGGMANAWVRASRDPSDAATLADKNVREKIGMRRAHRCWMLANVLYPRSDYQYPIAPCRVVASG